MAKLIVMERSYQLWIYAIYHSVKDPIQNRSTANLQALSLSTDLFCLQVFQILIYR